MVARNLHPDRGLRWSTRATLWLLTALLVAAIGGGAATLIAGLQRDALQVGDERLQRALAGAAAGINRSLLDADLLLAAAVSALAELPADAAPGRAERMLDERLRQSLLLRDLVLVDGAGTPLAAAQPSTRAAGLALPPAEQQALLAASGGSMAVSGPVLNPATGEYGVYLGRTVRLAGGTAALLAAEVPVATLEHALLPAREPAGLAVSLRSAGGAVLAVVPADDRALGRVPPPPGPELLAARHPTLHAGLQVAAEIPRAALLEHWRRDAALIAAAAAAVGLLAMVIALLMHRQSRRLSAARRRADAARALLDQALASMADGFLLCDAQDRVVAWNARYLEMFPWLNGVIRVGLPFEELAQAASHFVGADQSLTARASYIARRVATHRSGAGPFMQDLGGGRMIQSIESRTADGGVVSTYRDVTAVERKLARARDAAEASNRAKSRFLATVSHEIRTPLSAVLGLNELLLASELRPEQRQQAEMARTSGQALLAIINDILDLSLIEAGRLRLESVDFSLREPVDAAVAALRERAQAKGLALDLHCVPEPLPVVRGDPGRLQQLLSNLLDNAVKFTAQGRVALEVLARSRADGRVEVELAVSDTGIGIEPAALERIFEPFSQGDGDDPQRPAGTGLGLSICRGLVQLMDGQIEMDSEPGRGSRVTVRLALARGASPTAADAPEPGERLRVLVAEDNPVNQLVLEGMLAQLGHDCTLAANGREALAQLQAADYDVLLMDLHMPEMDGLSAARAIRALPGPQARTPIVAVTADAMAGDRSLCLADGIDDCLAKPIDLDQLRAVLARVGRQPQPA